VPSPPRSPREGRTACAIDSNTIVSIRTATNTAGKAITVNSSPGVDLAGLGITPDGKTVYILNEIFEPGSFPGTVIPLWTATNTAGKPITVESGPSVIAFTP
jgi:DNA-binding beta-propeller fold protein YncE